MLWVFLIVGLLIGFAGGAIFGIRNGQVVFFEKDD